MISRASASTSRTCATASPSNSAQPGAAPHDGVALALPGQPQQDPPGQPPARGVEPLVGLLGQPRDRPAHAPGLLVVGQAQRAAVAALPQLQQRRRDQRQRTGLALDVGDQRVDQLALDQQAGPAGRQLDRTAQLLPQHRADEHVAGAQQPRQLRVGGAATVEVGAHGDDHQRAPAHVSHRGHERVDERRALRLVAAGREHLLELVDRHDQPAVVGRRGERLLERAQRMLPGTQHGERPRLAPGQHARGERSEQTGVQRRGLAAAGRPDDPQERGARHPRDQLGHEPLAPEEEARVAGLERGQPLVRADGRVSGHERVATRCAPWRPGA